MTAQVSLTAAFITTAIALAHGHGYTMDKRGVHAPARVVLAITIGIATAVPVWSNAHTTALIIGVALQGIGLVLLGLLPAHATPITAGAVGGASIAMLIVGIYTGDPDWRVGVVGTTVFFVLNSAAATVTASQSVKAAGDVAALFL